MGTFFLVFAGAGAIVINQVSDGAITHLGVAITFGLVVVAMIAAFGEISGSHINPAVSVGLWASGRFPAADLPGYVLSQCLGAVAAAALLRLMFPEHPTLGSTLPVGPEWRSFVLETLLTFVLMFVILACTSPSAAQKAAQNGPAGLIIGGVVALEALFAGPICGASMNPARSLGPGLVSGHVAALWIYLTAPMLGALAAAAMARLLHPR